MQSIHFASSSPGWQRLSHAALSPSVRAQDLLRVRVGGMDTSELQSSMSAYVTLGLASADGRQEQQQCSQPLPAQDSATLLQHQWQTFRIHSGFGSNPHSRSLLLEVVAWLPGCGERSLGRRSVPLTDILAAPDGRLEITAPLGVAIEMLWMSNFESPPGRTSVAGPLGSPLRHPGGSSSDNQLYTSVELANTGRSSVEWSEEGSPAPLVGGMPPEKDGWVWGVNDWHRSVEWKGGRRPDCLYDRDPAELEPSRDGWYRSDARRVAPR